MTNSSYQWSMKESPTLLYDGLDYATMCGGCCAYYVSRAGVHWPAELMVGIITIAFYL